MLPLRGQGGPAVVTGPGLESRRGRHRSWRHLGSSHAGQGEILFLLTFAKTDTLSIQAWEGLDRAAQATFLQEQAPWVRCVSASRCRLGFEGRRLFCRRPLCWALVE